MRIIVDLADYILLQFQLLSHEQSFILYFETIKKDIVIKGFPNNGQLPTKLGWYVIFIVNGYYPSVRL